MPDGNYLVMGGIKYTLLADGQKVIEEIGKIDESLKKQKSGFAGFVNSIKSSFSAVGKLIRENYMSIRFAVSDAIAGLTKFTNAALEQKRAIMGLRVIAGKEFGKVSEYVKNLAADGQVSLTALSTGFKNLLTSGYTADMANELLGLSKSFALFNRQAGLSMDEAIQRMTEGIKNENSVLTDSAGITMNLSVIYKNYAKEHGKTVEALTQAEKAEAFLNQTRKESVKFVDAYNEALKGEEGQIGATQARLKLLQAEIGSKLLPVQTKALEILTGLLETFSKFPDGVQTALVVIGALIGGFITLGPAIAGIVPIITTGIVPAITAMIAGTATLATTIAVATGGIAILAAVLIPIGIALADNAKKTETARDYIKRFDDQLKNAKGAEEYKKRLEELQKEFNNLAEKEKDAVRALYARQLRGYESELRRFNDTELKKYQDWKKLKTNYEKDLQEWENKRNIITEESLRKFYDLTSLKPKFDQIGAYTPEQITQLDKGLEALENVAKVKERINLLDKKADDRSKNSTPNTSTSKPDMGNVKKWLEGLSKAEAIELGVRLKLLKPEDALKQIEALLKKDFPPEKIQAAYERLKMTVAETDASKAQREADQQMINDYEKLIQLSKEYGDAVQNLNTKMKDLSEIATREFAAQFSGLSGSILKLTDAYETFGKAKEALDKGTGTREDAESAAGALASAFIAAAQAVADFALDFWNNYDDTIQRLNDTTLSESRKSALAFENAWQEGFESLIREIPIIGGLLAKLVDTLWETEEERRDKAVSQIQKAITAFEHRVNMNDVKGVRNQINFYEEMLRQAHLYGASQEEILALEEKLYNLRLKEIDASVKKFEHETRIGMHTKIPEQIAFYETVLARLREQNATEEEIWRYEEMISDLKARQADDQKKLNKEQMDYLVRRYEHEMRMGRFQSYADQIRFAEDILRNLKAQHAEQRDIWDWEEKILGLREKQAEAQASLNKQIDATKKKEEDLRLSETGKQLRNIEQRFENLVREKKLNLDVTEDRQRAVEFYDTLRAKAVEMGLTEMALDYETKIAELRGGMAETRTYGAATYEGGEFAVLGAQVGNVAASVATGLVENADYREIQQQKEALDLQRQYMAQWPEYSRLDSLVTRLREYIANPGTAAADRENAERYLGYQIPAFEEAKRIIDALRSRLEAVGGEIPMFHSGGIVGPGTSLVDRALQSVGAMARDERLAKLQAGEIVLPKGYKAGGDSYKVAETLNITNNINTNSWDNDVSMKAFVEALEKFLQSYGFTLFHRK